MISGTAHMVAPEHLIRGYGYPRWWDPTTGAHGLHGVLDTPNMGSRMVPFSVVFRPDQPEIH